MPPIGALATADPARRIKTIVCDPRALAAAAQTLPMAICGERFQAVLRWLRWLRNGTGTAVRGAWTSETNGARTTAPLPTADLIRFLSKPVAFSSHERWLISQTNFGKLKFLLWENFVSVSGNGEKLAVTGKRIASLEEIVRALKIFSQILFHTRSAGVRPGQARPSRARHSPARSTAVLPPINPALGAFIERRWSRLVWTPWAQAWAALACLDACVPR